MPKARLWFLTISDIGVSFMYFVVSYRVRVRGLGLGLEG